MGIALQTMQRYVLMRVAPSSLRRLVIFAEKKHTVLRAMQSSSRNAIVLSLKECLSDRIISFMWERLL